MHQPTANRLLGYPDDTRLLIINADDFGMCHAINAAVLRAFSAGLLRSTSLMTPCPWAPQAMHILAEHLEIPFGIHLTAISDPQGYRWGPLAPVDRVPSLVDGRGDFYDFEAFHARIAQVSLSELELEFRAQIEIVLKAGLRPNHLDWHAIRFGQRMDILDLMTRLAREYGLAQRVIGQGTIEKLQRQGLPTIDRDFLDSYLLDPGSKARRFPQLLRELPAGLNEWAIHPGLDSPELRAMEPSGYSYRQADFDFLMSSEAKEVVEAEGIVLLDYRPLQIIWQEQPAE